MAGKVRHFAGMSLTSWTRRILNSFAALASSSAVNGLWSSFWKLMRIEMSSCRAATTRSKVELIWMTERSPWTTGTTLKLFHNRTILMSHSSSKVCFFCSFSYPIIAQHRTCRYIAKGYAGRSKPMPTVVKHLNPKKPVRCHIFEKVDRCPGSFALLFERVHSPQRVSTYNAWLTYGTWNVDNLEIILDQRSSYWT